MMKTEIESQTKIHTIPTLIPVNDHAVKSDILNYNGDDFDDYLVEIGYTPCYVDQFEYILTKYDPKLKLLDNDFYRLKKETDYIDFLNEIFNENGANAILFNLGIDFSDTATCIDKIERLDKIDQYIVFNLHKTYVDSETYAIADEALFEFFTKGFLREVIPGILYFDKLDIFLSCGYDMALPIFFKDVEQINKFKKKAKKFNIFLRN